MLTYLKAIASAISFNSQNVISDRKYVAVNTQHENNVHRFNCGTDTFILSISREDGYPDPLSMF